MRWCEAKSYFEEEDRGSNPIETKFFLIILFCCLFLICFFFDESRYWSEECYRVASSCESRRREI